LFFSVKNSLSKKDYTKDKIGGVGLENVQRRLELLYPHCHTLDIEQSNNEFSVALMISLNR
jgi:two-component system LytT family sensor kinase